MTILTILTAKGHHNLCKTVTPKGVLSYDQAKYFSGSSVEVSNLSALEKVLRSIQNQPNVAIILGDISEQTDRTNMRRLIHSQIDSPATIVAVLKYWFPVDMDIDTEVSGDPIEYAISLLPKEFHDCAVVIQFTSSHGIKKGIRVRFFFGLKNL